MAQYPPIQQVDEHDHPVGGVSMTKAYEQSLWHRVVLVLVFSDKGILLQKRGPNVATNPLKWDFSAGGHVDEGETYEEAASRELEEEIGLTNVRLEELYYGPRPIQYEILELKRFAKLYKVVVPADTEFIPEKTELAGLRWFSDDQLSVLINDEPANMTEDLKYMLQKFYYEDNGHKTAG